jgi:hypothetical protein
VTNRLWLPRPGSTRSIRPAPTGISTAAPRRRARRGLRTTISPVAASPTTTRDETIRRSIANAVRPRRYSDARASSASEAHPTTTSSVQPNTYPAASAIGAMTSRNQPGEVTTDCACAMPATVAARARRSTRATKISASARTPVREPTRRVRALVSPTVGWAASPAPPTPVMPPAPRVLAPVRELVSGAAPWEVRMPRALTRVADHSAAGSRGGSGR